MTGSRRLTGPWIGWSVVCGLLLGLTASAAVLAASAGALAGLLPLALCVAASIRAIVPAAHRRSVFALVSLAFLLRTAIAACLYAGSLLAGRGGFVTGDDMEYARLAEAYASHLHGVPLPPLVPPHWSGQDYLFGTYVYLESAAFFVFGRQVLLMEFMNTAFASVMLVLLHDITRRLFGPRPGLVALAILAFFPSLALWSALNLKDALVLLLVAFVAWLLLRLRERPTAAILIVVYAAIVTLQSLRQYIFIAFALLTPAAVALTVPSTWGRKHKATIATAAMSALLLWVYGYAPLVMKPLDALEAFESVRRSMSIGARTGFTEPPPVQVREGDTFVVESASCPGAPRSPVVHIVPVGARIVQTCADGPFDPGTVVVRPGDVVVVGTAGTTPAPSAARRPLILGDQRDVPSAQFTPVRADERSEALVINRTLSHIPIGFAHALLAPFPWQARRLAELATIPEMLLWYGLVAAALWTLVSRWRRWRELFPLVAFVGLVFGVFVLAEGNVGILYRHRAMIVPFTVVIASPALIDLARRLGLRRMSG